MSPACGITVASVPGPATPLAERSAHAVIEQLAKLGACIQEQPGASTQVILTTARFAEVLDWREAPLFSSRRRFGLDHTPSVFTVMAVAPADLARMLSELRHLAAIESGQVWERAFPGLAAEGWRVLREQGRRGGPLLALIRLLQAQAKSIRIILFVGTEYPVEAYHFDLVGAHPRSSEPSAEDLYRESALRILAAATAGETTDHITLEEAIPHARWETLSTPQALQAASRCLKQIDFFAPMVRVTDLVPVPSVGRALASYYSEGCFATWDPDLGALIATASGSTRPFDKGDICDADLAVIAGIRTDGCGALVRPVAGKLNPPPSSEAMEMMAMDQGLPSVNLPVDTSQGEVREQRLPAMRSKLHGHRGIEAYDPRRVEYVAIPAQQQQYLVPCASQTQARAVSLAFARSQALRDPLDPRQVVFTVLPGHGIIIVERWMAGKAPFQLILEHLGAGSLEVTSDVPQGPLQYVPQRASRNVIQWDGRESLG